MDCVILGWGSLIWDRHSAFDRQISRWKADGPTLKLEFSRISGGKRKGALTLVIDEKNGVDCTVLYAKTKRCDPRDAICDLRSREGTILNRVGYYFVDSDETGVPPVPDTIKRWAAEKGFDVVIWTGLGSNFSYKDPRKRKFSIANAISYLRELPSEGKKEAVAYICRAPTAMDTPLRRAFQREPHFASC